MPLRGQARRVPSRRRLPIFPRNPEQERGEGQWQDQEGHGGSGSGIPECGETCSAAIGLNLACHHYDTTHQT
eukprot:8089829-Heterocapsa_arctica.AAC.1